MQKNISDKIRKDGRNEIFKQSASFLIAVAMIFCFCTPLTALAKEEITVDDVLRHLEEGTATEVFEEHSFSDLTDAEISADPILHKMISQINAVEHTANSNARIEYQTTIYGSYFTDTITDATGATVKYYLAPRIDVDYGDVPRYGNESWYTRLYVYEYITLNGIEQDGYMNRIKLKNIEVGVGGAPDVIFKSYVSIMENTDSVPQVNVDELGFLSAILSILQQPTAAAITSALANIEFDDDKGSEVASIKADNTNLVGAKFVPEIYIDDTSDEVAIACLLGTAPSATTLNATCYFSFRWQFDVYKGSNLYREYTIKKEGSVLGNAA